MHRNDSRGFDMTDEIKTWERKHYVDGGGHPQLFYVIYGKIDSSLPLSRVMYRSSGCPQGITIQAYGKNKHPDVPASFREGYVWDELAAKEPQFASSVTQCEHCLIVRGSPADSSTLNFLRDVVGLITYLLDHGGFAVYDPFILQWWNKEAWKEAIFSAEPPMLLRHVVILVSKEDDPVLNWYHTRGMLKFGRPDISIHGVPSQHEAGVLELCKQLMERQAHGQIIPDGLRVMIGSPPIVGTIHHAGNIDDPDFNNVHLEVKCRF